MSNEIKIQLEQDKRADSLLTELIAEQKETNRLLAELINKDTVEKRILTIKKYPGF